MDVFKNTAIKVKDRQKEKLSDKYFKIKQNDNSTFQKLFSFCCLPVINSNTVHPSLI